MKNKFLVGVITVFVTLVLCIFVLNIIKPSKDDYYFERKFVNQNILLFEKQYEKMYKSEFLMSIRSDNQIIERNRKIIGNSANYELYFNNFDFKDKMTKKISLKNDCDIIFCNKTRLFYRQKFKLFEYLLDSNAIINIGLDNLIAYAIKPVNDSNYLCFGELFLNNEYTTGFFIINFETKKIKQSKVLEISKTSEITKNALAYSGFFTNSFEKDKIIYCCNKYSKVYFFDANGIFKKELTTNDKVPLPKISQNNIGDNFYNRSATWNNNMGLFIKNNNIYICSIRTDLDSTIIIDKYSYERMCYIQSYKLNYNKLNAFKISKIFINKNRILFGFDSYYASFKFSRYI